MKHQVKDWMTKNLLCVDKEEDVKTAEQLMHNEAISHVLVFDKADLVGVLSSSDIPVVDNIKRRFNGDGKNSPKISVGDVMSRQPITIDQDSSMSEAIETMKDRHVRSLPTTDTAGNIVGIITHSDLLRYALITSRVLTDIKEEA